MAGALGVEVDSRWVVVVVSGVGRVLVLLSLWFHVA
jgi:hypothetical protein